MTESVLKTVVTRGYWKIILRPVVFKLDRISTLWDCENLLSSCRVAGGWDYPHLQTVESGDDYIWCETNWEEHKEFWRFYQTGQFVHYVGFVEDWWKDSMLSDRAMRGYLSGEALDIIHALFRITQIYEFADRLASKGTFGDYVNVHIGLHRILNRKLIAVNRNWDLWVHIAALSELESDLHFATRDLIEKKYELALQNTLWILERFNWRSVRESANVANLSKEQEKLLKGF